MAGKTQSVKRKIRDTVFSKLFEDPENQLELYRTLHPEDESVSVEDFQTVTIQNVLLDQMYNDLGFTVRDRLLLLTEAQSTWSLNIIPRILMYFGETLNDYIIKTKQNPYGRTAIVIPRPEFYVIYTGTDKKKINKFYTFADEFLDGNDSFINVKVRILQAESGSHSIVTQYVEFTKVLAEQEKIYKRDKRAIIETIRICKERNILRKFFEEHEQEVIDIMTTLYNDEELNKAYERDLEIQAAINTCRDMELSESQIKDYIIKKFSLTEEVADNYLAPIPA